MSIDQKELDGAVFIYLVGELATVRIQGRDVEGYRLKPHMRVQFANGEEVMMDNPLYQNLEFRESPVLNSGQGPIIVTIETEPAPNDANTANGFSNRSEVWRNDAM